MNDRKKICLYALLRQSTYLDMPEPMLTPQGLIDEKTQKLLRSVNEATRIKVQGDLNNRLVDESALSWITKISRLDLISLAIIVSESTHPSLQVSPKNPFENIIWQSEKKLTENIIFSIDIWSASINEKLIYLNRIRTELGRLRTPQKETKWITEDAAQVAWCYSYLCKKNLWKLPEPITIEEFFIGTLCSINFYDQHYIRPKEKFLELFYKAWKQGTYRAEGNEKFNFHLPLKKETKRKLTKIAALSNISEAKTIEILINEEFKRIEADKY